MPGLISRICLLCLVCCICEQSAQLCLPDGVAKEDRLNISIAGRDMPIGLVSLNWESSFLYRDISAILFEEVLGYNVDIKSPAGGSVEAVKLVAGCREGGEVCDRTWSDKHIAFEVWSNYEAGVIKFFESPEYISIRPSLMRRLDFRGFEAQFIFPWSSDPALAETGRSLAWYQNWNAQWMNASTYFSKISEFQIHGSTETNKHWDPSWGDAPEDFRRCSNYGVWLDQAVMDKYVDLFNDTDALSYDSTTGVRQWKCVNDTWWTSPACRHDPMTCVPLVTAGYGWGVNEYMHKAAAFNIPVAIAVVYWYAYVELPIHHKLICYWWNPDISFLPYGAQRIMYPSYNIIEWNEDGRYTTQSEEVKLSVWTNKDFQGAAPKPYALSNNMKIYGADVENLLSDTALNRQMVSDSLLPAEAASTRYTACQWLLANQERWKAWIPDSTSCSYTHGYGMVDRSSNFVSNRSLASDCELCRPGKYAVKLKDEQGSTSICVDCEKGTKQDKGAQTSCSPCDAGSFSDTDGSFECTLCPKGKYQALESQTRCDDCATPFTSQSIGSTSDVSCICPVQTYRPCRDIDQNYALRDGCVCDDTMYLAKDRIQSRCMDCTEGLDCKEGADEINYPCSKSEQANTTNRLFPVPAPGFVVPFEEPVNVYLCLDVKSCPGKDLGACGEGLKGIACGACSPGWYKQSGKCFQCGDFEQHPMFLITPILFGPAVVFVMYKTSQSPVDRWGVTKEGFSGIFYLTLVFVQTVAVILAVFPSVPDAIAGSLNLASGTADVTSLLRLDCAGPQDFQTMFVLKLSLPNLIGLVFFFTWAVSQLLPKLAMEKNVVFGSYGGIIKTFFITIATLCFSLLQCYEHPNGEFSMRSDAQILRFSDEWNSLVAFAAVAILVNCLGVVALFTWAMCRAPAQFRSVAFRRRWKFLLMKMRPSVHWWMLTILIKGLWLALTSVVFETVMYQSLWLMCGLLIYFTGGFILMPWRNLFVAVMDTVFHTGLLMLCMCMPFMITFEPSESDQASIIFVAVALGSGMAILWGFLKTLYNMLPSTQRRRSERLRTTASIAAETFPAMTEARLLADMMALIPALDIVDLKFVAILMHSELFANRLSSRLQHEGEGQGRRAHVKRDVLGLNTAQIVWT
eukprot:gb/GFBE01027882.1/.p1 GENE.gb/GFBE01027882.1/~~gb/GFBE01027882.1/.p1  ORF type:complete len:1137 (+),score=138.99 gb/GFBE01027882.1/:1-3411(+)